MDYVRACECSDQKPADQKHMQDAPKLMYAPHMIADPLVPQHQELVSLPDMNCSKVSTRALKNSDALMPACQKQAYVLCDENDWHLRIM